MAAPRRRSDFSQTSADNEAPGCRGDSAVMECDRLSRPKPLVRRALLRSFLDLAVKRLEKIDNSDER